MAKTTPARARVLILGGGYAGIVAARQLGRLASARAQLILIAPRNRFEQRIRLHQEAAGQHPARPMIGPLVAKAGVTFQPGRARAIDVARRRVSLEDGVLEYDFLIVATGSITHASVPGATEHAYRLDDTASAWRLRTVLRSRVVQGPRPQRSDTYDVVVVGSGLSGIETIFELRQAFPTLRFCLVSAGELAPHLGGKARAYLRLRLAQLAIDNREGQRVGTVASGEVGMVAGAPLRAAVCVWAGGFTAAPLASEAGLATDERGRLLIDGALRSLSDPRIHGAGDAAISQANAGAPALMSCRLALPGGAAVARSLSAMLRGGVPGRATHFRDFARCVSLGRQDGIVQFHRADGSLRDFIISGRKAAWLKERICRYTLSAIGASRGSGPGVDALLAAAEAEPHPEVE